MRTVLPPLVFHPYDNAPARIYHTEVGHEYEQFLDEFEDHLGADCWALTVNEEIIINSYHEHRPLREKLMDKIIRDAILGEPHSLFVNINRSHVNTRIIVYMFQRDPWFLVIDYDPAAKTYTTNKYSSIVRL